MREFSRLKGMANRILDKTAEGAPQQIGKLRQVIEFIEGATKQSRCSKSKAKRKAADMVVVWLAKTALADFYHHQLKLMEQKATAAFEQFQEAEEARKLHHQANIDRIAANNLRVQQGGAGAMMIEDFGDYKDEK